MKCLMCDKDDVVTAEIGISDYICTECGALVQAKMRCNLCKTLSNIDSLICSRCESSDIIVCYVQGFRLTESGKKVANKLANEAQVESLLLEIKEESHD